MMKRVLLLIVTFVFAVVFGCAGNGEQAKHSRTEVGPEKVERIFTNSIGMQFVRIEPGGFTMGQSRTSLPDELTKNLSYPKREDLMQKFPHGDPQRFAITIEHVRSGDFDEKPAHKVKITRPFYMGMFEVTNAQYEMFDPSHRALRGKNGFSRGDDEAVIFVSWHEAKAFCDWLSKKEGQAYRLPTEAEWEYACRAGTTTHFWMGDSLPEVFHKNARRTSFNERNDIVPLTVGQTRANPWGVYDMHGNVEEWCNDWYGPYSPCSIRVTPDNKEGQVSVSYDTIQADPVGLAEGDFKVTRGGSHGTNLYYLRSANRMGTLPENSQWLIGFRVVRGALPKRAPLTAPPPERYQLNVKQQIPADVDKGPNPDVPYFRGPRRYVKIPKGSHGPLYYHHNHDPAIVECPNGDLLAIWYTCVEERGRELAVAASRLRYGHEQWEPASLFWDAPDRNDHCPALWFDGKDTIYHFNGLCVAGKWEPLAIIMRTSKDNGVTWSKASLIAPKHGFRQMVGEPVFRTRDGAICVGADAEHGSTIWVSRDNGKTWYDPGGKINGIHAGIVELTDGRLMALGRNQNIDGWMPKSISSDMGRTWKASASIFQPLTGGQRAALIRLQEGPLFFASFARDIKKFEPTPDGLRPPRHVSSIFGAVSYDDGETWSVRRVISDGKPDHPADTIDGAPVLMNAHNSEPLAYLSVCQGLDGVIHLISSTNHYAFNLAWLKSPAPDAPKAPTARSLPVRKELPHIYDGNKLPSEVRPRWHALIKGLDEQAAKVEASGSLKVTGNGQRWSNERIDGFGEADAHKGLAVEAAVQIEASGQQGRSFDFELFVRGGTLTVNHYFVSITPTGVYYLYDKEFVEVAEGLDNSRAMHAYRLAVRDDAAVQIYRDGQLLGVQMADLVIGWSEPARGSFLEWGGGAPDVEAHVDYISCDFSGPSQPE